MPKNKKQRAPETLRIKTSKALQRALRKADDDDDDDDDFLDDAGVTSSSAALSTCPSFLCLLLLLGLLEQDVVVALDMLLTMVILSLGVEHGTEKLAREVRGESLLGGKKLMGDDGREKAKGKEDEIENARTV